MYNKLTKLLLFPFLFVLVILISCQKELSFSNPNPAARITAIDSTLLIESITGIENGQDSIIESYTYDTASGKITLTWHEQSGSYVIPDGTKAELSYNNDSMITHGQYIYPPGYVPQPSDYSSVDITYDAEKVVKQITFRFADGSAQTQMFTKNLLPSGGYELNWIHPGSTIPADNWVDRKVIFNQNGQSILNVTQYRGIYSISPAGDTVFDKRIYSDTIFYDGSGSIVKMRGNEMDDPLGYNQPYISYNFLHETKGDQLYNLRQRILKGIANIPFVDPDVDMIFFGLVSPGIHYEDWQFSKYPLRSVDVKWYSNLYNLTDSPEFDSRDRLVKLKLFYIEAIMNEVEYKIKYYK